MDIDYGHDGFVENDQPEWDDDGGSVLDDFELREDREEGLLEILRKAPHRPDVIIRVTVTNEATGEIVENVQRESAERWERGYRQYFKVRRIMEVAESVAARVAWDDDNRKGRASG